MSIEIKDLSYTYMVGTPYERTALEEINLTIGEGSFVGIIGHTGSGKSTLIQHLNGLLKPRKGKIIVDGEDIWGKGYRRSLVRQKIGLVFQYPEHQLFEETVYRDIAFGPHNMGLGEDEIEHRVRWAMGMVGLDFQAMKDVSPFDLSGGQRRRIAIAGVLAMSPKYLILDEPTAGLDPRGRREILDHIRRMHTEKGITIVLVTHNMEEVALLADWIIVMENGRISLSGTPEEVFSEGRRMQEMGLGLPVIASLMARLKEEGWAINCNIYTVEQAEREILKGLRGNGNA